MRRFLLDWVEVLTHSLTIAEDSIAWSRILNRLLGCHAKGLFEVSEFHQNLMRKRNFYVVNIYFPASLTKILCCKQA
jgi:hypothetical protein